jgi:hypothetical protein
MTSSPDIARAAAWREHPDQQQQAPPQQPRRRFPFDAREDERGYRRPRSGSGSLEDERDSLPEWCLEDAEEETGTFDSSGAFLSLKVGTRVRLTLTLTRSHTSGCRGVDTGAMFWMRSWPRSDSNLKEETGNMFLD